MTLLARCNAFLRKPASGLDLADFVQSEIGRAADASLEDTAPLVLYLATEEAREEFLQAIREAMPGMISRKWP